MADEQDEWLDANAAERLLRGESVEPVDDHARTGSRRLEEALRAVRTPRPSGEELPGEAAALAAFREASRATGRGAAVASAGPAGQREAVHTVRIGGTRTSPSRRPRWTRPVRYGLAVSLAGCALGGVAVAGGTGMLPAPFGGDGAPAPATSVSVAASPEDLGAEVPGPGPSVGPPVRPGESSPPAPEATDGGADPEDGATGTAPGGGGAAQDGDARDDTPAPDGSPDSTDGNGVPDDSAGGSAADVYAKSIQACRAYRDDDMSRKEERRLVKLAKGERNLARFCERVLGEGRDGGSADRSDSGTGDGSGGAEDDGSGEGGKGSLPSLPSVSFRTAFPRSAPEGGETPEAAAGALVPAPPVPPAPAR
ncbi:hypothetical protein [Streptomyces sp. B1I3]|uniref:hypothetical protein n=1 Tax=Streptomyces sp. B1I3 TaxID=3042264 RepID=UPI002784AA7D|nr:hypothetical protein [Streptomyces sp. B1I3]MDQ0794409.1 hypothetical protein [Streptomyces sp. B1I3]